MNAWFNIVIVEIEQTGFVSLIAKPVKALVCAAKAVPVVSGTEDQAQHIELLFIKQNDWLQAVDETHGKFLG